MVDAPRVAFGGPGDTWYVAAPWTPHPPSRVVAAKFVEGWSGAWELVTRNPRGSVSQFTVDYGEGGDLVAFIDPPPAIKRRVVALEEFAFGVQSAADDQRLIIDSVDPWKATMYVDGSSQIFRCRYSMQWDPDRRQVAGLTLWPAGATREPEPA